MKKILFVLIFAFATQFSFAQFKANYDESKIPKYKIPDPLRSFKGKKIKNVKKWEKKRRPELLEFFTENVYGEVPGKLKISSFRIIEEDEDALNGKAKRKQIEISFKKNDLSLDFTVLLYLPKNINNAPLYLGYNFYGNHTITTDVNVIISEAWARDNPSFGIINNQLTEQSRGVRTNRWALEKIIDAGYGLATIYYCEIDPDKNDLTDGIHPFFYKDDQQEPASHEWGALSAWSWALSRTLDYFEQDEEVDETKVIVFGHSRLGKTSLWVGATDPRFAGVISNNSGCGGAALSKRKVGETVWRITSSFPHWFCQNFRGFAKNEKSLPVDQHQLLSLIAPRPLYVASAEQDRWADPKGEFLSALYATPVYELYNKKGITQTQMLQVNKPIQNTLSYHIRTGKHDVTDYDWEQYIKWADKFIK